MDKEKQELREKTESSRKEIGLKWDGWDEEERERQGGGMLIIIAFIAGLAAVGVTVIYILAGL